MGPNSSNVSHLPSSSSTIAVNQFLYACFTSTLGFYTTLSYVITIYLVLLPLCVLVVHHGYQQHWKHFSSTTIGHSDLFTYHMVIMELTSITGSTLCLIGICAQIPVLVKPFVSLLPFCLTGQMLFHILTCSERYLAVIHPITYVSLKNASWIRVRNLVIGVAWIISLLLMASLTLSYGPSLIIMSCFILGFSLLTVSFCSISVLCSLIRPGPGDRDRQQVNQMKLRAFQTIISILAALLLRIVGCTLTVVQSGSMSSDEGCGLWLSVLWFSLPSSLVLPLLFLHRVAKLQFCWKNK